METVLRAVAIYLFLLFVFRVSGQRSLGQATTFDFVLVLIIAETTQQGLLGDDTSLTTACLSALTLVVIDVGLSKLKFRWNRLDQILEGVPIILVAEGVPQRERMERARVDDDDILSSARELHGLVSMNEIRYAILERNGVITIIPKRREDSLSSEPGLS